MKMRSMLNPRSMGNRIAAAGIAIALIAGVAGTVAPTLSDTLPGGAVSIAQAAESSREVQRDTYSNEIQGFSMLVQGDVFGINEQENGSGQVVFYLKDSIAETDAVFGGVYTVYYYAGGIGDVTVDGYFKELMRNVKNGAGDTFRAVSAGDYEMVTIAGVSLPAAAWYRQSPDSGLMLFEMRALETLPDGGVVMWGMSAVDDEADAVFQGLTEAIATFRVDPSAYGAARTVTVSPSMLSERPADSSSSTGGSVFGGLVIGTETSGTTTTDSSANTSSGSISYTPVEFTDGRSFTMKLPQGWKVSYNGGSGLQVLIDAYDPSNPAIRFCFWATQEMPASKNVASAYGIPFMMEEPTVANYASHLADTSAFAAATGQIGYPTWLSVTSSEVLGSEPVTIVTDQFASAGMDWMIADESIAIAALTLNDTAKTPVLASVYATVIPTGFSGFEIDSVQLIYVVTAPAEIFDDVMTALITSGCYGSFAVSESYARSSSGSGPVVVGSSSSDSSSGILDSYYYQQAVQDSAMQAWDDYILGRDRYTSEDGTEILVYY